MPILIEQERLIANDLNLINDPTSYYAPVSTTFVLIKDYGNVTLANAGILLIKFDSLNASGTNLNVRIKVGSNYVFSIRMGTGSFANQATAIYLAAGTYDIRAEGCSQTGQVNIQNFQCGFTSFNDMQGAAEQTYGSSIPLTVASRNTPAGPLNQATYLVQCFANTPAGQTNFENVGDNLTNGVSITIDGVQVSWFERFQDTLSQQAASAKLALPYAVGSAHTVVISKRNANTVVNISVIACPWILSSIIFQPLTLSFSQGSTFYAGFEPLFMDPTKFIGIGIMRGITFGSATDYYNSTSGTGLITYSVVIDVYDVSQIGAFSYGFGGCIEYAGVDAR